MRRSDWVRLLVVAAAVVLAACGSDFQALSPDASGTTKGMKVAVGGDAWIGFTDFGPRGRHPVHLVDAELLGVPPGMRVLGLYASRTFVGEGQSIGRIGAVRGVPGVSLEPVSHAVLTPGEPERWYLLAHLRGTALGTHLTRGIRVEWRAGSEHGSATFAQRAGLVVLKALPSAPS
jgi:hypothetical protein